MDRWRTTEWHVFFKGELFLPYFIGNKITTLCLWAEGTNQE